MAVKNKQEGEMDVQQINLKDCLFLKRPLPLHQMVVNIIQIFQLLAKLTLTGLIKTFTMKGTKLSEFKQGILVVWLFCN